MIEQFHFNLNLWRKAFVYEPFVPPDKADIRMVVDASYTAEKSLDPSAMIVSYKSDRETGDGINLNILDGSYGHFKGIDLPLEIVRLIERWNPCRVRIEKNGPGAYDLLHDVILLLAKEKNLALRGDVGSFTPRNTKRAKPERIRKIQTTLLEPDPQFIRIYCSSIFPALLDEAEKFAYESDTNFERPDDLLDCIALTATRGEL